MRKFFLCFFVIMLSMVSAVLAEENIEEQEVFFKNKKTAEVPIVMYHLVTKNGKYIGRYAISPDELEADLQYLKENEYNTVTLNDLIDFVENGKRLPKNPVILTFDDGNASDYTYLYPLLEQYDMKAVVSIMGKETDECTEWAVKYPTGKVANLTWPQVKEMHKSGRIEIQNHSYNLHGSGGSGRRNGESSEVYHNRLGLDLNKLQEKCNEHAGCEPTAFTYPLGVVSKGSEAVLKEMGLKASLSCQEGLNILNEDETEGLFLLKRDIRPSGYPIKKILDRYKNNN